MTSDRRRRGNQTLEAFARRLLALLPSRYRGIIGLRHRRKCGESCQDAAELAHVMVICAEHLFEPFDVVPKHQRRPSRIDRQATLEVVDHQEPLVRPQHQLAAFEDRAVLISENREQYFVSQVRLDRQPVDVEEARERRARPVLEHVTPPRVGVGIDSHVIRHAVDDEPETVGANRGGKSLKVCGAAEFGIELSVIADVVAVRATRARGQDWRAIAIADAEPFEIRSQRREIAESERATELNAIGGGRCIRQAVSQGGTCIWTSRFGDTSAAEMRRVDGPKA